MQHDDVFVRVGEAKVAADEFVRIVRIDVMGRQERHAMLQSLALCPYLLRGDGQFADLGFINGRRPQPMLALERVVREVRNGHDAARRHKCLTNQIKEGRFSFHERKSSREMVRVKHRVNQNA